MEGTHKALWVLLFVPKLKSKEEATMDMKKLCEIITSKPELRDIPLTHIFRVAFAIFEVINSGECFYDTEELSCLSSTTQTQQEEELKIAL